jgi:hypothetical protein
VAPVVAPGGPNEAAGCRGVGKTLPAVFCLLDVPRCSHSIPTHALDVSAPVNESPAFSRAFSKWAVLGLKQAANGRLLVVGDRTGDRTVRTRPALAAEQRLIVELGLDQHVRVVFAVTARLRCPKTTPSGQCLRRRRPTSRVFSLPSGVK